MEIFLDEVSQFLTRFGNLKWSDWLWWWSHDVGMRFHEIWCLKRCWMWFGLKKMWNILLKRLPQHGDLLNKSSRSYILLRSSREIWHQTICAILPISSLLATFYTIPVLKTLVKKVPVHYILLRTARDSKTLFRMILQHNKMCSRAKPQFLIGHILLTMSTSLISVLSHQRKSETLFKNPELFHTNSGHLVGTVQT